MPVARPPSSASFHSIICRSSFARVTLAALIVPTLLLSVHFVRSTTPVIELIRPLSTNQVLLHFDTDANRTYILQYSDNIGTNGLASSTWSYLYTAPLLPTPNHYIVPDWRTNSVRFYRLKVTP